MSRSRLTLVFSGLVFFWLSNAWAAPCCGGASSLPSLITGDDRAQLATVFSQGSVVGDAPSQGIPVFRGPSDSETTQILRLDGAYLVSESFQLGAGIPVIRRSRAVGAGEASAQGLGDVSLDGAYEFLPELSYSEWKPKGFVFLQTTLPTSPSVYDANAPYLIDARGRGFLSLSLGAAFVKTHGNWDFLASAEAHRAFSRSFQTADQTTLTLTPGFGASSILGAGWSPEGGAIRIGLSISPIYEGAIRSSGEVNSVSDPQLVWNTSIQLGYAFEQDWSTSLTYTDQTLLGPAKNVSLSRTVGLVAQKRWPL